MWYARVCMGVCGSVRKCEGVCKCVCWMNFQNIFWRLDSIHQRTLIRILYEFFFQKLAFLFLVGNLIPAEDQPCGGDCLPMGAFF